MSDNDQMDDAAALTELYGSSTQPPATDDVPAAQPSPEVAPEQPPEVAPASAPEQPATPPEATPAPAPATEALPAQEFIIQALEEFEARRNAPPAQPPEQQATPQPLSLDDFMSEDDKAAVAMLQQEWGDIASPMQRLLAANAKLVQAQMRQEFEHLLAQQVAPVHQVVQQQLATQAQQGYWAAVSAAHPDVTVATAAEVVPRLQAWIETQPAFLRQAYHDAAVSADPQEAIELLHLFKGAQPQQPARQAVHTAVQKPAIPQSAVAATAAPPQSKRQQVSTTPDPNDEAAALAEIYQKRR